MNFTLLKLSDSGYTCNLVVSSKNGENVLNYIPDCALQESTIKNLEISFNAESLARAIETLVQNKDFLTSVKVPALITSPNFDYSMCDDSIEVSLIGNWLCLRASVFEDESGQEFYVAITDFFEDLTDEAHRSNYQAYADAVRSCLHLDYSNRLEKWAEAA